MAKARFTKKGNVQIVMSPEQWDVLNQIFMHVRMGNRNEPTSLFSDLLVDLTDFNDQFEDSPYRVYVTRERSDGTLKEVEDFCIELGMVDEDDDNDQDWD